MYINRIHTTEDSLELLGGKGRSLAKMTCAGFRVPGGFLVTADAYRRFVADNELKAKILNEAAPELRNGYPAFDRCAAQIETLISQAPVNAAMIAEIQSAYLSLGSGDVPVAVRSSANAEDLPDFSFAGQQETYLNVRGAAAVAEAVQKCWGSLWTAQAISYRHQNGIQQSSVAMAVVVQEMVPSEVSGILFTANPATGERSELVLNASFGLGEAVVGGQVTPDTFIVERATLAIKESILGPKEQQIVYDGEQGVRLEAVCESDRNRSSMSGDMLRELCETAIEIENLYDGVPQDIEWAFCGGTLHLLQSRPITNLPVQPIEVVWEPTLPARYVSRRQIVENMPEPVCPLFEELYLTRGLEAPRVNGSGMAGGGPMFVTVNGYAYQRFDWPQMIEHLEKIKKENPTGGGVSEQDIDVAEYKIYEEQNIKAKKAASNDAVADVKPFREALSEQDQNAFDEWYAAQTDESIDAHLTMPESDNPTYIAFNNTQQNDAQIKKWANESKPRLEKVAEKWRSIDIAGASDQKLLEGIVELGIEEGRYWTDDSSHTFGVAKSTDDQLQCFLKETLPERSFISGQFLTGIASKTMQANADLFEIAKQVRANDGLAYTVLVVPAPFLMQALIDHQEGAEVVTALNLYLRMYGHQGYSMDFIEPTQVEDPSGLFASLKNMVRDREYDPINQTQKTAKIRRQKLGEITGILSGLEYWQFRFRLWFALKYNFIREEVAFLFGYTWSIFRPMAFELGRRLVGAQILTRPDDVFFLVTNELEEAIDAREANLQDRRLATLVAERRELREARKRHHPVGTMPEEARKVDGIAFKETQIKNDESSNIMRGFPVSSGKITQKASVILGPSDFDKMVPGSILVSPLTTPAWTQLFAHAAGLVTDIGSILAHGSIVAREYGIPAVLGVGDGTQRITHGQTITIDGDAGVVEIHD
jgi:pyruvate,water dikinase